MSKFDESFSQTSTSRNFGSHSHSDLDKIRHDEIMEMGDRLATQAFGGHVALVEEEKEEGVLLVERIV